MCVAREGGGREEIGEGMVGWWGIAVVPVGGASWVSEGEATRSPRFASNRVVSFAWNVDDGKGESMSMAELRLFVVVLLGYRSAARLSVSTGFWNMLIFSCTQILFFFCF